MPTGVRNDPYRGYNFRIELDNTSVASFREASGLSQNTDPVDYREGTDAWLSVRKLPGLRKYSTCQSTIPEVSATAIAAQTSHSGAAIRAGKR